MFTFIYGVSSLPNFAHGSLYVLTGFATWTFLHKLAINEVHKQRELEKKYIDGIISDLINSHNLIKINEFIEFLRSHKLVPYTMTFLFMEQHKLEKGGTDIPQIIDIDYSIFTDEVLNELNVQKQRVKETSQIHSEAQCKATEAFREYEKVKKSKG